MSKEEPISYVVKALGKSDEKAHNTVRVSFSSLSTIEEVKELIKALESIIKELK